VTEERSPHTPAQFYMTLRRLVGLLGVLMPFTTSLGAFILFDLNDSTPIFHPIGIQRSISYYYYQGTGGASLR
jgi:hypothetical protein